MQEEWKKIIEPYGNYEISNFGNCRSFVTKRLLSKAILAGYVKYDLYIEKYKKRNVFAHRLVATMFCENFQKDFVVNHKDGDISNNHFLNLEWVTIKENNSYRAPGAKKNLINGRSNDRGVEQRDLLGNLIRTFANMHVAGRELGLSFKHISNCCLGQRKTHGGFRWNFVPQPDLAEEEWRRITVNENSIIVSNMGRIIGPYGEKTYGAKGEIGYNRISKNGTTHQVHRLIAEAFCEKPINYTTKFVVDHSNGIRNDNYFKNLKWCTREENTGLGHNKPLKLINVSTKKEFSFISIKAAEEFLQCPRNSISRAFKKEKLCNGYKVEFI